MLATHVVFLGVLLLNIAVVAFLQHFRKRFPPSLTAEQQNIVLGPFAFVVTLYAFLLSFVVINLWQTFTQADRTAVIEAETVAALYRLTESFPGAQAGRQTLTQYVRSVVQDEWPAMADGFFGASPLGVARNHENLRARRLAYHYCLSLAKNSNRYATTCSALRSLSSSAAPRGFSARNPDRCPPLGRAR